MSLLRGPDGVGPIPGDVVVTDSDDGLCVLLSRPDLHDGHGHRMESGSDLDSRDGLCRVGRWRDRAIVARPLAAVRLATEDEMDGGTMEEIWAELTTTGGLAWRGA